MSVARIEFLKSFEHHGRMESHDDHVAWRLVTGDRIHSSLSRSLPASPVVSLACCSYGASSSLTYAVAEVPRKEESKRNTQ